MIRLLGNPSYTSPDGNISGDIDYLEGNLFGKVKFNATFEFSSFVGATDGNNVEIGNGDGSFPTYDYLTDTSGGFAEFRQGDLVDVTDFIETATGTTLLPTGAYLIDVKVDDNTVRLSKTNGDPLVVGVDIETGVADQGALRLDQEPEAASFSYGLIENDEGTNFISKVDGQELRHTIDSGAALPLALTEMEYKYKASAKIGSVKIRKVSEDLVNKIWRYEIEQVLFIHPFYLLSDLAANQEGVYPSIWAESACLRHVFRLRLYSTNSDSPRFQEVVYDGQEVQGNTGYEDENYNGIAATYTLASLDYTNSIGQATKDGTTVIQMSFDNITSNGRYVVLNFILLPEQDEDFKNINSSMQENYCFDRVVLDALGAPQDGEQFGTGFQVWQNCSASATASLVNVTAQINFGADVKAKIDGYASKRYKITANIYGDGEAFGSADETNVFVDFNEIGFEVPVGTIDVSTSILPHDINTVQDGFESPATVFANDEIVSNSLIFLDSDTFSDILLESVEAQLVASDGSTEAVLQSQLLDVSGQPVVGGARLVSEEFSQGLNVRNDELRAKVKLLRESASDTGTKYAYRLIYPFLFRWEYWEQLILDSLPSEFFDAAERFNGYNHNWNRLGDLAGFQVYYRVIVRASVQGGSITSLTSDFELENLDYNEGVATSREIKLFDDATELTYLGQPFIKDGIFTKIVAIWTFGSAVDAADYWAYFHIGKFENHTFKTIQSFSSVYDREGISYLSSNGGNGLVSLANNGANVIEATCFVDPNKFPADADDYTVFARIDKAGVIIPFIGTFDTTLTEGGSSAADTLFLPITGTVESIDHGDGQSDLVNPYTYSVGGEYTVKVLSGSDWHILYNYGAANDRLKIKNITKWGNAIHFTGNLTGVFATCDNLIITATDVPNTDGLTNITQWWDDCDVIEEVPRLNEWDLLLVTSANNVFRNCLLFDQELNLNLPLCATFSSFAINASSLNSPITISVNVDSAFPFAFSNCTSLNKPIVIDLNGNKATFQSFLQGATSMNSTVTINGKISNASSMHASNTVFNQNTNSYNLSECTSTERMHQANLEFNNGEIGNTGANPVTHTLSLVENTNSMYQNCPKFNQNIGSISMALITDCKAMIQGAATNNAIFDNGGSDDIGSWTFRNDGILINAESLLEYQPVFNRDIGGWNTRYFSTFRRILRNNFLFNHDLSGWSFESATNMAQAFDNTALSESNANLLIIKIDSDATTFGITGVTLGGVGVNITAGSAAETARDNLVANGWVITGFTPV